MWGTSMLAQRASGSTLTIPLRFPVLVDSVEEVGSRSSAKNWRQADRLSGRRWLRHWDQLGEFPKVLGSCCEKELVMGAIWSP